MRKLLLVLAAASIPAAAPAAPNTETAVLAGGCFWGVEAVFEHVKGVTNVVSGFAGGSRADATYDRVSSESTGHAEAVKITYDPSKVSYAQLLQVFFTVAHDPTEVNHQGPDKGPSYRSAIFPQSKVQERFARAFIARLDGAHIFKRPIATKIEHGAFFAAEEFHQNFYDKHPDYPYIVVNDKPKVVALEQRFPKLWKS